MTRFMVFLYLLFFGGVLLVAGILWVFVDEFFGRALLASLLGAVMGVGIGAAALFLVWQFLKGAWYVFDRVWPS